MAVADTVLGPYVEDGSASGPTVLHPTVECRGPGHNSVVKAPDDATDMIVYHAWDPRLTARRMFVEPLVWTAPGPRVSI